jgi:hypothetical protein
MHKTDIFIIGAPKCGTISLHQLMAETEGMFAPRYKEPHFFGEDLRASNYIKDPAQYAALYAEAPAGALRVDTSPLYYTSGAALRGIRAHNPKAKVIFCIRDPYRALNSMYNGIRANGKESALSLQESLARLQARVDGKTFSGDVGPAVIYNYHFLFDFKARLAEIFAVFDPAQVFLFNLELYRQDEAAAMRALGAFIGRNFPDQLPKANPAKATRSKLLQRLIVMTPYRIRKRLSVLPKGLKRCIVELNSVARAEGAYVDDDKIRPYVNLDDQNNILQRHGILTQQVVL